MKMSYIPFMDSSFSFDRSKIPDEGHTIAGKIIHILGTYETKDKRGRKTIQYKVHFQGWSSSWDRKVSADFVLKDTEENRKLQRDLAEKAQLQLYVFVGQAKIQLIKSAATSEDSADASTSPSKLRPRGLSEDNFSSGSTFEKHEEDCYMNCETDSYSSSIESIHDEDRVMLRISERLRQYLEYDHDMIVKYAKQHTLPSRLPAIAILENFVKQTAVKMVFSTTQAESTRRRNTQQRTDKKEKEFDKIITTVGLLKKVADGLRIYFDFTITDHLLYKEEKEHALSFLSEENLKNFTYVPTPAFSLDWFNAKSDTNEVHSATMQTSSEHTETATTSTLLANTAVVSSTQHMMETTTMSIQEDQPQRRKLRSHRSDDCDLILENCLSSIASTSSGASTPLHSSIPISNLNYLKSLQPISPQIRDFLQSVLSWRLLPSNAAPGPGWSSSWDRKVSADFVLKDTEENRKLQRDLAEKAQLQLYVFVVKLPEFLNATNMSDDKLKVLLQHLDTFTNYLESHKEWFNEDNYARSSSLKRTKLTDAKIETTVFQDQRQQQLEQQRHQNLLRDERISVEESNFIKFRLSSIIVLAVVGLIKLLIPRELELLLRGLLLRCILDMAGAFVNVVFTSMDDGVAMRWTKFYVQLQYYVRCWSHWSYFGWQEHRSCAHPAKGLLLGEDSTDTVCNGALFSITGIRLTNIWKIFKHSSSLNVAGSSQKNSASLSRIDSTSLIPDFRTDSSRSALCKNSVICSLISSSVAGIMSWYYLTLVLRSYGFMVTITYKLYYLIVGIITESNDLKQIRIYSSRIFPSLGGILPQFSVFIFVFGAGVSCCGSSMSFKRGSGVKGREGVKVLWGANKLVGASGGGIGGAPAMGGRTGALFIGGGGGGGTPLFAKWVGIGGAGGGGGGGLLTPVETDCKCPLLFSGVKVVADALCSEIGTPDGLRLGLVASLRQFGQLLISSNVMCIF
uniref:Uncharacterized protein n=1 Tax=Glossina palpalis gambiensis TaxID=67801 RepID=A0A1B0B958_9MUSC